MEIIKDKDDNILAMLIRAEYVPSKTEFYTPDTFSQQLGIIKYPAGHKIKPHYHNLVERNVQYTQEVLVVRKGKVKVNIYDKNLDFVIETILNTHDVILLASGGHGFEMFEDAEMLEVKQGPYNGIQNDKTHF